MSDVTVFQSAPLFVFVNPEDPTPDPQIYISIGQTDPIEVVLTPIDPTLDPQQYNTVTLGSAINVEVEPFSTQVEIFSSRSGPSLDRRTNRSSWQARLGMKTDVVKKKIVDNSILLSAHPTDMLRVVSTRDERSGDILSRTIVENEILPVLFPALKDIPIRRIERADGQLVLSGVDTG